MPKPIVIGLTAPFQHGKTELKPVIEDAGWTFVDLNDDQNGLRLPGTERRARYEALIPGCLDEEGGETLEYYRHIAEVPEVRGLLLPEELPLVAEMAQRRIKKAKPDEKIILSWELWHRIVHLVKPQHMLVFYQPWERWMDRLHKRIQTRGWGDWTPEDDELIGVIQIMDAIPDKNIPDIIMGMAGNITATGKAEFRHTIVNVSPEDWGAPALRAALDGLSKTLA